MARDSRTVRKARRIRRERSLVYKMLNVALAQRDQARMIAAALEQELKKYDPVSISKSEHTDAK